MACEDFEHAGRNGAGRLVAVDHEGDDWRLRAMRGVEPSMLFRLAWPGWSRSASPAPELSKVEPWSLGETARNTSLRRRRAYKCRQKSTVLAPVG
jgi:hypothetical protein